MPKQMLKYLFIVSISILSTTSCEIDRQTTSRSTTIWRGFHHVWEYNHRVNRMGDWLQDISYDNGYVANAYHAAASGIGPDRNRYNTYLTALKCSQNFHFTDVSESIILAGPEETIDSQTISFTVDLPQIDNPNAIVLINGFDLYSRVQGSSNLVGDGESDKLFNFSIVPNNITANSSSSGTEVSFDVAVTLGGACSSLECSSGVNDDFFDYFLMCNFQIIVGPNDVLQNTNKQFTSNYSWERPANGNSIELQPEDYRLNDLEIEGQTGFNIGFAGIKSFQFETQKGFGGFDGQSFEYPHMHSFNMSIDNLLYNEDNGKIAFDAELFFKNWARPIPFFSFGAAGSVDFKMDAALIQMADERASFRHYTLSDEIQWWTTPLNPAPPNSDGALNFIDIRIQ